MKSFALIGTLVLLLAGCGDSGPGAARSAGELCDEVCGWPDQCFVELGVPVEDAQCIQSCESQVDVVGIGCLAAIADTVACLGTCDFDALTEADINRCQSAAEAISTACE